MPGTAMTQGMLLLDYASFSEYTENEQGGDGGRGRGLD